MDSLSGASHNFFAIAASFALAVFAATRAFETLRSFHGRPEDFRHLRNVALLSVVIAVGGLAPLALSEHKDCLLICNALVLSVAVPSFGHLSYELVRKEVTFELPFWSWTAYALTALSILLLAYNTFALLSIVVYKLLLLWGILVLCLRFYLVVGVVSRKVHEAEAKAIRRKRLRADA